MAAYLSYLHRFMLAFGKDKVQPWLDVLLLPSNLETRELKLRCYITPQKSLFDHQQLITTIIYQSKIGSEHFFK